MAASDSDLRNELRCLVARLIHLAGPGTTAALSDPVESILASLDHQAASDLLTLLRSCCDGDGLLSIHPRTPDAVRLTWPHRGQYYVQTASGGFFIHPDAATVLSRQLEDFIKQKLLSLDVLLDANRLRPLLEQIGRLKNTASQIIAAIARSEDLRTQLWLKKKFVLETHYCVTLDRVPRELYPEIAANAAQRTEWVRLYRIDEMGCSEPPSVAFLEANPRLMLDTCFFGAAFTDRLLASFDDLDAAIDGLLIQADNFHALSLLEPRYRDGIDCIYADPPYNTGGDGLSYPDRYEPSAWLTFVDNRLRLAHRLLRPGGACFVSIDENEQARLELLLADIFSPADFVAAFVWEAGRKNDSKLVSVSHEYMLCYVKGLGEPTRKGLRWRVRKEGIDEIYAQARRLLRRYPGDYPRASLRLRQWLSGLPDNHPAKRHKHYHCVDERGVYHPGNISWPGGGGPRYEVLHPVTGRPCRVPSRGWMYPTPERMAEAIRDGRVHFGPDETRVPCAKVYLHASEHHAPSSVFYRDGRAAMKRLRHILGEDAFCNPKDERLLADRIRFSSPPDAIVLDPFAGSGAAAHAAIDLNRADGGRRRYVLIESGPAFDSVLRTRIQRVAYASNWKHGRPQTHDGLSHLLKYLRLEPYEPQVLSEPRPSGSGTSFTPSPLPHGRGSVLANVLSYMESADGQLTLDTDALADPFDCRLRVASPDGQSRIVPVDVIETLNHLLGLRVQRIRKDETRGIRWIEGLSPTGQTVLVIWRKLTGDRNGDEKTLAAWFESRRAQAKSFDVVYVHGENNLEALRRPNETWSCRRIETAFEQAMFDQRDAPCPPPPQTKRPASKAGRRQPSRPGRKINSR